MLNGGENGLLVLVHSDHGGGGAGRAIALPLFCWDLLSRAPPGCKESQFYGLPFGQVVASYVLAQESFK